METATGTAPKGLSHDSTTDVWHNKRILQGMPQHGYTHNSAALDTAMTFQRIIRITEDNNLHRTATIPH